MALLSTIATYVLIFIGGLVRVSGAGLGCPDWPKCFGSWIPPTNAAQLPPEMDPSLFNFTLAWIEYANRLVGVVIGILIALTAVLAIRYFRNDKKILYTSIAAALLVAFQGWQGGRVVALQLKPHVVSLHTAIALVIISLLVYVTYQAHEIISKNENRVSDGRLFSQVKLLWVVTIIQIILGTEVRSYLEMLSDQFPLMTEYALMSQSNYAGYIHGLIGVILAGGIVLVGNKISKFPGQPLLKLISRAAAALAAMQVLAGISLVMLGRPALIQIVHLWIASLLVGALVILYCELKPRQIYG